MSKKRAVFTIIACSIAVLILTVVLLVGLGTDGPFGILWGHGQGKESQLFGNDYTVELDPEHEPIEELEIDWQAGPVQVIASDVDTVRITETCSRALMDNEKMKVDVSGKRLAIGWDHSRFRLFWFVNWDKSLLVELPRSVAQALTEVECSNVSGDMEINGLTCTYCDFSSVSGAVNVTDVNCSGGCGMSTTSGDVTAQSFTAETLTVSTTSGALSFLGAAVTDADFNTVSGEFYFQGKAEDFEHSTISGLAHAEFDACPKELEMDSVSGALTVVLPTGSSFREEHSTVSGDFTCNFPGKNGSYGIGKPQGELQFSTTSGGILVMAE